MAVLYHPLFGPAKTQNFYAVVRKQGHILIPCYIQSGNTMMGHLVHKRNIICNWVLYSRKTETRNIMFPKQQRNENIVCNHIAGELKNWCNSKPHHTSQENIKSSFSLESIKGSFKLTSSTWSLSISMKQQMLKRKLQKRTGRPHGQLELTYQSDNIWLTKEALNHITSHSHLSRILWSQK